MNKQKATTAPLNPAPPPSQKKSPRQSRAKFTYDVILSAAEQLLEEGNGLDAVTTRGIAQRAGVGIGTLYEYFPNRDAILVQLLNRTMQKRCQEAVVDYLDRMEQTLPEFYAAVARRSVRMDRQLLGYGRDFHSRYARHFFFGTYYPQIHSPERKRAIDSIEQQTIRLLSVKPGGAREPDLELAAFMTTRALRAMIAAVIEERPELLDSPSFAEMLTRIMLAIADYPA